VDDHGGDRSNVAAPIRVSVVVPAYNEVERIAQTIACIVEHFAVSDAGWELIVIDDGSRDGTGDRVQALSESIPQLRLLRHRTNRGKGAAVRTGVLAASGELVLTSDADLSVPIETFDRFAAALATGADVVIASRRLPGARILVRQRRVRESMGWAFTRLANAVLGMRLSDFTCGFKLFHADAARALFGAQRRDDWSFDAEILYRAQRGGWRIVEVPVEWTNRPDSRVRTTRAAVESFVALLRIRASTAKGPVERV
jgi:dolichyl-phosphate beta-glucosyltransferase